MKFFYLIIILVGIGSIASAQQDPHFSHYMFNRVAMNPGSAGSEGKITTTIIRRDQWVGINFKSDMEGAPKTTLASIDGAINESCP